MSHRSRSGCLAMMLLAGIVSAVFVFTGIADFVLGTIIVNRVKGLETVVKNNESPEKRTRALTQLRNMTRWGPVQDQAVSIFMYLRNSIDNHEVETYVCPGIQNALESKRDSTVQTGLKVLSSYPECAVLCTSNLLSIVRTSTNGYTRSEAQALLTASGSR